MSDLLPSILGATLFVATLLTGVLSLVYPRRITTWQSRVGIHLPVVVMVFFRVYVEATYIPGFSNRPDFILLSLVVFPSLAVYVVRLLRLARDSLALPFWNEGEKSINPGPPFDSRTKPKVFRLARGLAMGLYTGFLSAFAWDVGMTMPIPIPGLGLLMDLLPGMLYGLVVWSLMSGDVHFPDRKPARLVATALAGGIAFVLAILVTGLTFGAFYLMAPMLGGLVGSLLFGTMASRLLRSNRVAWRLGPYVLSGTVAGLALFPLCYHLASGPDTPSLHRSLYLGFMVWQGVTAATLALSRLPRKEAISWEAV